MQNLECVLGNETYILWDFEIRTYYLIQVTILDLVSISKKNRTGHLTDFAVPVENRVKIKESEKIDKYLDLARELKKQ